MQYVRFFVSVTKMQYKISVTFTRTIGSADPEEQPGDKDTAIFAVCYGGIRTGHL